MIADREAIKELFEMFSDAPELIMGDGSRWTGQGTDDYIDTLNELEGEIDTSSLQKSAQYMEDALSILCLSSELYNPTDLINFCYNDSLGMLFIGGGEIGTDIADDEEKIKNGFSQYMANKGNNIFLFYKTTFNSNLIFEYINNYFTSSSYSNYYFLDCEFNGTDQTTSGLLTSSKTSSVYFHNCVFNCTINPSSSAQAPLLSEAEIDTFIFKCSGTIEGQGEGVFPQIIKAGTGTLGIYETSLTLIALGNDETLSENRGIISDTGKSSGIWIKILKSDLEIKGSKLMGNKNVKVSGISIFSDNSYLTIVKSKIDIELFAKSAKHSSSYLMGICAGSKGGGLVCELSKLDIKVFKKMGYIDAFSVYNQSASDISNTTINVYAVGERTRGVNFDKYTNNYLTLSEFNITAVNDFQTYNTYALELWDSPKLYIDMCKFILKAYRNPNLSDNNRYLVACIRFAGNNSVCNISDYTTAKTEIYCETNKYPGIDNSASKDCVVYGELDINTNEIRDGINWFATNTTYSKGLHYYNSILSFAENQIREIEFLDSTQTCTMDIYICQLVPSESKNVKSLFFITENVKQIGETISAGAIVYNANTLRPIPNSEVQLYVDNSRANIAGLYHFVIFYDKDKKIIEAVYGASSSSSEIPIPTDTVYFSAGVMSIGKNHKLQKHAIVDGYTGDIIFTGDSGERYGWDGEKNNSYSIEYAYTQVPATAVNITWKKGKWGIV